MAVERLVRCPPGLSSRLITPGDVGRNREPLLAGAIASASSNAAWPASRSAASPPPPAASGASPAGHGRTCRLVTRVQAALQSLRGRPTAHRRPSAPWRDDGEQGHRCRPARSGSTWRQKALRTAQAVGGVQLAAGGTSRVEGAPCGHQPPEPPSRANGVVNRTLFASTRRTKRCAARHSITMTLLAYIPISSSIVISATSRYSPRSDGSKEHTFPPPPCPNVGPSALGIRTHLPVGRRRDPWQRTMDAPPLNLCRTSARRRRIERPFRLATSPFANERDHPSLSISLSTSKGGNGSASSR